VRSISRFVFVGFVSVASLVSCVAHDPPRAAPATECRADADCRHTGCNGEVCSAGTVVTPCVHRCEHGCWRQATCGCDAGRCVFRPDPDLARCLERCKSATPGLGTSLPAKP